MNELHEKGSALMRCLGNASKLPVRLRMAWGISVIERALRLYSEYFLKKYFQVEFVDYVWSFAQGSPVDKEKQDNIIRKIEGTTDDADNEGYGGMFVMIAPHVMAEINGEAGTLVMAVEYTGFVFSSLQLYRQYLSNFDHTIPKRYFESLDIPFLEFAAEALDMAMKLKNPKISRNMFDSIEFSTAFTPLKPEELPPYPGERPKPPVHERRKKDSNNLLMVS